MLLLGALTLTAAAQPAEDSAPIEQVPTAAREGWQVLRYQGIPAHEVAFLEDGLTIRVRRSASPVVYRLPEPVDAAALTVCGRVEGALQLPPGVQGENGFDDYLLRAGVVLAGPRRPSLFQRLFAPPWLKSLFDLAPEGSGISEVRFFILATEAGHVGARRRHPSSDLLLEEVVTVPRADGTFTIDASIDSPERTLALWLSADGDDTGSTFTVRVEGIALTPRRELVGSGSQ